MSDFQSWDPSTQGPARAQPDQDMGPAAARTVAWLTQDRPRDEVYEILEMLALLPDQDPKLRNTTFPVRNPSKENTACTPRATQMMRARKLG